GFFGGFVASGVGERHGESSLSSAAPVISAAVAQRTSRIRVLTTLRVIGVLDAVRVAEGHATLGRLCGAPVAGVEDLRGCGVSCRAGDR
ncbi:LLM class flavin-dependent oxidoreductase, partial [Streptomyces sp. SID3343]|uniref:LLM class flavin-dependent oxidoreductase n=1 Tax=Streptomyces sp. SID3343 TaxID=2690260 RepID=UPI00136F673F